MSHSAPPPEPPAIVEYSPYKDSAASLQPVVEMGERPDRLQQEARGDRSTEPLTEALPVSRGGSEMPAEPPALTQSATLSEASATSPPVTSPPATSPAIALEDRLVKKEESDLALDADLDADLDPDLDADRAPAIEPVADPIVDPVAEADPPLATSPLPTAKAALPVPVTVEPVDPQVNMSVTASDLGNPMQVGWQEPTIPGTSRSLPKPLPRGGIREEFQVVPQRPVETQEPLPPLGVGDTIELKAERQIYDERNQVFFAEGNVLMRYRGVVLDADRLQVNLRTRLAIADGNIAYRSGQQLVRGERMRYNLVQDTGTILQARGEVYLPTAGTDFAPGASANAVTDLQQPLSDRLITEQPFRVTSAGGIGIGNDANGGVINRVRFEADALEVAPEGWQATNIRLTNDPFSPPELELRAATARGIPIGPGETEIRADNPRLVFDQETSVPLLRNSVIIGRDRDPAVVQVGFDEDDRGGLFLERTFQVVNTRRVRLRLTPQYFLQQSFDENGGNPFDSSLYGLRSQFSATLSPRTSLTAFANFNNLSFGNLDEELRASVRLRQVIGTHLLSTEYSFRDRLFNGSLGFQTVQQSVGAVLTSPVIPLGRTGINLTYQAGINSINAETDRLDLLDTIREDNDVTLTRFQASASLSRAFWLWRGKPLPPRPDLGLRYTPTPVVPFLQFFAGLTGVTSLYSSDESQNTLTAFAGIQGQVGHFSKRFFDYTAFSLGYAEVLQDGTSPFLFDRVADTRILFFGLTQQVVGPFRVGFRAAVNLETNEAINTVYTLEYSRRTYGVTIQYNPERQTGSFNIRISDFNWSGRPEPFDSEIRSVEGGLRRDFD